MRIKYAKHTLQSFVIIFLLNKYKTKNSRVFPLLGKTGDLGLEGIEGVIWNRTSEHILSFSGPARRCSVNEVELIALKTSPLEAVRVNLHNLMVEEDSICTIRWTFSQNLAPWGLGEVVAEL